MDAGEEATLILVTEALREGTFVNAAAVMSETYDPDLSNNYDNATVDIKPVHKNGTHDVSSEPVTLPPTGNPIVMVLLALISVVGVSIRRRD